MLTLVTGFFSSFIFSSNARLPSHSILQPFTMYPNGSGGCLLRVDAIFRWGDFKPGPSQLLDPLYTQEPSLSTFSSPLVYNVSHDCDHDFIPRDLTSNIYTLWKCSQVVHLIISARPPRHVWTVQALFYPMTLCLVVIDCSHYLKLLISYLFFSLRCCASFISW